MDVIDVRVTSSVRPRPRSAAIDPAHQNSVVGIDGDFDHCGQRALKGAGLRSHERFAIGRRQFATTR